MGTRLMTTKESPLHETYKKLSIEKQIDDTLYSTRFDGLGCRVLDTPAAHKAIRQGLSIPKLLEAIPNSMATARMINMPWIKLFIGIMASGWETAKQMAYLANAFKAIRVATENGDTVSGVLPVGQITGMLKDNPPVAELFERIVTEAEGVSKRVAAMMN
jgi:enoyl-[acyl-carrier protein] reductase II